MEAPESSDTSEEDVSSCKNCRDWILPAVSINYILLNFGDQVNEQTMCELPFASVSKRVLVRSLSYSFIHM